MIFAISFFILVQQITKTQKFNLDNWCVSCYTPRKEIKMNNTSLKYDEIIRPKLDADLDKHNLELDEFDTKDFDIAQQTAKIDADKSLINRSINNAQFETFKKMYYATNEYNINKIINYVTNKGGFSNQEIEFLFEEYTRLRVGRIDLENIIPRTLLIAGFQALVGSVAKKFFWYEDREELFMKGMETIVSCVDKYNLQHENDAKFITYATHALTNNFVTFTSRNDKLMDSSISIYEPLRNDDDTNVLLIDVLEDRDAQFFVEKAGFQDEIKTMLQYLTPLYQFVVIASFGLYEKPKSLTAIGNEVDLSRERIRQIKKDSLRKIRESVRLVKKGKDMFVKTYPVLTEDDYFEFNHIKNSRDLFE